MSHHATRRAVLRSGTVALAGLAGCIDRSSDEPKPRYLTGIELRNRDDVVHALHVFVERDGEPVYWRSHRLGPYGTDDEPAHHAAVDPTWDSAEGGAYVVRARLDDDADWRTADLTTYPTSDDAEATECWALELNVSTDGGVEVLSNPSPDDCPAADV